MDTLRIMLLSLLIGASVSSAPMYMDAGPQAIPQVVFEQQPGAQSVQPQVAYVPPQAPQSVQPQAAYVPPQAAPVVYTISTGTSITRELYRGCSGEDVRVLQRMLRDLSYNVSVDGYFGTQTRNAVLQFQRNNGLKADGIAGVRTIRRLASGNAIPANYYAKPRTTLSYGMVGQDVADLQTRLMQLGYYADVISGKYLTNTRNAVRWFQSNNLLPVDGIAGPMTLSRIYSASAIPASGTPSWPGGTVTIFTRNLYIGLSGADVTYLQQLLRDLGYFLGTPTGYFGTATQASLRLFQLYNGLSADGVAGSSTFSKLLSGSAVPFPGTTVSPPGPGPTSAPTPAPTQKPGEICTYCGNPILIADGNKHSTRAACGVHMSCVSSAGGDHTKKLACGHYECQQHDGRDHSPAACGNAGHFKCDGTNHGTPPCGVSTHFLCEGGSHEVLACGHHYTCNYAPPLSNHTTKYACNRHYLCLLDPPAGHYICSKCGLLLCTYAPDPVPPCVIDSVGVHDWAP